MGIALYKYKCVSRRSKGFGGVTPFFLYPYIIMLCSARRKLATQVFDEDNFFSIFQNGGVEKIRRDCPTGTFYNSQSTLCTFTHNGDCIELSTTKATGTTAPTTTTAAPKKSNSQLGVEWLYLVEWLIRHLRSFFSTCLFCWAKRG